MKNSIWRVVDANLNRVREGLRVCEDILRFICNDKKLTQKLKSLRHDLEKSVYSNSAISKNLIHARESQNDIGKKSFIKKKKSGFASVLTANFKRAEEGLRVLEECSKIVLPKQTARFQAIRFQVYVLEKKAASKF